MFFIPAADTFKVIHRPSFSDQNRLIFKLGLNLRLVLALEWETLFPVIARLPVISQTFIFVYN